MVTWSTECDLIQQSAIHRSGHLGPSFVAAVVFALYLDTYKIARGTVDLKGYEMQ